MKWDGHEMARHELANMIWADMKWPGMKWDIPNQIYARMHLTLREQALTLHKSMLASIMCSRAELG